VLVVGIYLVMRGGTGSSVTPTPTPSSGVTPTPTATATSSGTGSSVAGATSLQYTVSVTNSSGASLGAYTYYAKNAGTSNFKIRIEIADPSGSNIVYIVNGALQKAWMEVDGQWTDISSSYSSYYDSWSSLYTEYTDSLATWTGGDWTYTSPSGETIRIYNVNVNPSLADSLFEHS
jgi:hypothetical protein